MKLREKFSLRLYDAREVLRLSQNEMAKRMSMSERQYISYEEGKYDKDEKLVKKYTTRLEQVMDQHSKIAGLSYPQAGDVAKKISDLEKQISELRLTVMQLVNKVGIN